MRFTAEIDRGWDDTGPWLGTPVRLTVTLCPDALRIDVDAPFHDDPPPIGSAGRTDRLWEHEVVELFLVGRDDRYLEIELGPHGHWLGLQLHGRRNIVDDAVPIAFEVGRDDTRWRGVARVDAAHVPTGLERWNAFAIHGQGLDRRYLAAAPVPGDGPDFHRIELFPRFD